MVWASHLRFDNDIWFEGKSPAQRAKKQYNYWFYGESRAKITRHAEKYYSQYTWRPRPTEVISVSSILGIDFSIPQVWVWISVTLYIKFSNKISVYLNNKMILIYLKKLDLGAKNICFEVYWTREIIQDGIIW